MSEYVILSSKDIVCVNANSVSKLCIRRINQLFSTFWKEVVGLQFYDLSGQSFMDFEAGKTVCVSDKDFMFYQRLNHCWYLWYGIRDLLHFCTCLEILSYKRFTEIEHFVEEELKRLE